MRQEEAKAKQEVTRVRLLEMEEATARVALYEKLKALDCMLIFDKEGNMHIFKALPGAWEKAQDPLFDDAQLLLLGGIPNPDLDKDR